MEFKELFGSFTGHRDENRTTGTRYGSTGSARSENWRRRVGEVVADQKLVTSNLRRRMKLCSGEAVADGPQAIGDGL
ncbi:hypothetical protein Hanom_Chr07g00586161 [Helianthus anomalus]